MEKEKYELMLIIKPLLPEDIKSTVIKNVEKLVEDHNGSISKSDVWGKRHLAYPINGHPEGYYIVYNIEMEKAQTSDFDEQLGLTNGVLRYLRIKESGV